MTVPSPPKTPSHNLDAIVEASHAVYDELPRHGKPVVRHNGVPEWTVLATISVVVPPSSDGLSSDASHRRILPISAGTGVKVLPANRLPPQGDALHDCHAEILARRGFVRWLLEEAGRFLRGEPHAGVLEMIGRHFRLKEGVEVWLYVSALPCGDASTLHTAAHQPPEMAAAKSLSPSPVPSIPGQAVRGRNGYENYGAIRTKPGRADSVPTISFSCSDKIAGWNVLGLQGALLEVFEPIYLDGIVVGGVEEEMPEGAGLGVGKREWRERIREEAERAFFGRLSSLEGRLPVPYQLNRPFIHFTTLPFPHSKPAVQETTALDPVPSVLSLSHITPFTSSPEVLCNGCKQGGVWKSLGEVLVGAKHRSKVSKYEMLQAYLKLRGDLHDRESTQWPLPAEDSTYFDLKHKENSTYQTAKNALRGQVGPPVTIPAFSKCGEFGVTADKAAIGAVFVAMENDVGYGVKSEAVGLARQVRVPGRGGGRAVEMVRQGSRESTGSIRSDCSGGSGSSTSSIRESAPPFRGWIVSGERWESFTAVGVRRGESTT